MPRPIHAGQSGQRYRKTYNQLQLHCAWRIEHLTRWRKQLEIASVVGFKHFQDGSDDKIDSLLRVVHWKRCKYRMFSCCFPYTVKCSIVMLLSFSGGCRVWNPCSEEERHDRIKAGFPSLASNGKTAKVY